MFVIGNTVVTVGSYHKDYFSSADELLNVYGLVLSNFNESDFDDFIEFLQDSTDNNFYLNDMLVEYSDEYSDLLIMGELILGKYNIGISGSYSIITDSVNGKKWVYYGD